MYNGAGLQTARGSGTNGYVQNNKFSIKPKTSKVVVNNNNSSGFGCDSGQVKALGIPEKPNKDIVEHERKRKIEVKLAVLEDELIELQGYTGPEVSEKLREARALLEAADVCQNLENA